MPTYNGTNAADTYAAPDAQDWVITGLGGADVLTGGAGNDTITGGKANDMLNGGAGNDTFLVGKSDGIDTVDGGDSSGAGYDIIKATADDAAIGLKSFTGIEEISADGHANVSILGDASANIFDFSAVLLTGIKVINAGAGNDIITGNTQDNVIMGSAGDDVIQGGAGDDIFLYDKSAGYDTVNGDLGFDTIKATVDNAVIGLRSFIGIEEITADGHVGVRIQGAPESSYFDFSSTILTGDIQISGGGGNDTIIGNNQANVIEGAAGNDTLSGLGGDDIFLVGKSAGYDGYDGGLGTDVIKATTDNVLIGLLSMSSIEEISGDGHGNVKIVGTTGDDKMDFSKTILTDITAIDAGAGNDIVIGSAGDDVLRGGLGDDIIRGGAGNDSLYGEQGHDQLFGGSGDDSMFMSPGADYYNGGSGYDVIYATQNGSVLLLDKGLLNGIEEINANGFLGVTIGGANSDGSYIDLGRVILNDGDIAAINGTNGGDTIIGSRISDVINGGIGDDTINGNVGDDLIHGGANNDTLIGGSGFDEIHGDAGNDIIDGGRDDDTIFGDTGNDTIIISANSGYDTVDGGTGTDTIVAAEGNSTIAFASITNIEAISWNGVKLADIVGSLGDDHLDFSTITLTGIQSISGNEGNDTITGTANDDRISGDNGNDTLLGGIGNDVLIGGAGTDTQTGGAGNDIFESKALDFQGDTITDFGAGDSIHLLSVPNPALLALSYDSGVLTITGSPSFGDGIHITLPGSFTTGSFEVVADGAHAATIHLIA